jgi:6-phosphofructokinase 1
MKRIGILTSGGDAPGMNAAIRAIVRTAVQKGLDVFGVRNGYGGLMSGDFFPLGTRDVGGIIQRGGTILGSSRSPEFATEKGRAEAMRHLELGAIDGLVVIGGNGTQAGAYELDKLGVPLTGVASTIDNDLFGFDITLGVDTALNIALEAIDRLKVTASSHHRAFLVEVMGRDSGYLAVTAGIAGGAEAIVIPEAEMDPDTVAAVLRRAYAMGKGHAIVVVSEGASCNARAMANYFAEDRQRIGLELRVTVLGHVQRGGAPGAFDRLLASRMGAAAAKHLIEGRHGVVLGLRQGVITDMPLSEVAGRKKALDPALLELAGMLAEEPTGGKEYT